MADDWSQLEVEAIIADYFEMLEEELRGRSYNKSEHRRRLASQLGTRSSGAIERKHQNISAALIELGFPYIPGYKPLANYQHRLFEAVEARLQASAGLLRLVAGQVGEEVVLPSVDDILAALVEPPKADPDARLYKNRQVREPRRPRVGVDYLALEARNRSLGDAGEEFVVRFETARLLRSGHDRLAARVERVSRAKGDGLGYDILSFEPGGRERLIEVKTTAYGPSTPFFVTHNELATSRREAGSYHLYRAFTFRRQPRLFAKKGALDVAFDLEPSQFIASVA